MLRKRLEAASDNVKIIKPGLCAPRIEKKKADACFVVTRQWGRSHLDCYAFKGSSSEILAATVIGEQLSNWYYKNAANASRKY